MLTVDGQKDVGAMIATSNTSPGQAVGQCRQSEVDCCAPQRYPA